MYSTSADRKRGLLDGDRKSSSCDWKTVLGLSVAAVIFLGAVGSIFLCLFSSKPCVVMDGANPWQSSLFPGGNETNATTQGSLRLG